jgi:hypothetical protein
VIVSNFKGSTTTASPLQQSPYKALLVVGFFTALFFGPVLYARIREEMGFNKEEWER